MNIIALSKDQLPKAWPLVCPLVEMALEYDHGGMQPENIYNRILKGNLVMLLAIDDDDQIVAEQTLEVWNENGIRICNLMTTGGNRLREWKADMMKVIDSLAAEFQCDVIRTRGRLGWLRELKSEGFVPLFFVAEKRVKQ